MVSSSDNPVVIDRSQPAPKTSLTNSLAAHPLFFGGAAGGAHLGMRIAHGMSEAVSDAFA